MTYREALLRLHAAQSWRRLPPAKSGRPYGPGFFKKRSWVKGVESENRRVSVRLSRMGVCVACEAPLPPNSTCQSRRSENHIRSTKAGPQRSGFLDT